MNSMRLLFAAIVFGVMGWMGIVVDVGTVMAPAVALRLSNWENNCAFVSSMSSLSAWFRLSIDTYAQGALANIPNTDVSGRGFGDVQPMTCMPASLGRMSMRPRSSLRAALDSARCRAA